MGFADTAMNAAKGALGITEKAIIEFHDYREYYKRKEAIEVELAENTRILDNKIANGTATVADRVNKLERQTELQSRLTDIDNEMDKKKTFTVQFNPSELEVTSRGGGVYPRQSVDPVTKTQKIEYEPEAPRVELSVNLIFDKVDNQDAFTNEKFVLNPTAIVTGVAKAFLKKDYSVQKEVEGFLAAIRNPSTKRATFNWKDISFTGNITTMGVRYTMFNPKGEPIRAVMQILMIQIKESSEIEGLKADYNRVIKGKSASVDNSNGVYQAVKNANNLFNLPI